MMRAEMVELGLFDLEPTLEAAARLGEADAETQAAALIETYHSLAEVSLRLLEKKIGKVEQVLAETAVDDPLHKDLAQIATAFRCQQEGLTSLIEFFATGDKQALGRARTGIASGRRMAESLEQTARGRR